MRTAGKTTLRNQGSVVFRHLRRYKRALKCIDGVQNHSAYISCSNEPSLWGSSYIPVSNKIFTTVQVLKSPRIL